MRSIKEIDMADDLLQKVAEFIAKKANNPKDLTDTLVVFEGTRPSAYLRDKISKVLGFSYMAPSIFSLNDLVEYIVSEEGTFTIASELDVAHKLYEIVKRIAPEVFVQQRLFSDFISWAEEINRFIDRMYFENKEDDALINVQANAAIGYDVPESINKILEHIVRIKTELRDVLSKENKMTRGMLFQKAKELSKSIKLKKIKKIIFVNILFFQKCEEEILKNLSLTHETTFFYQGSPDDWKILKNIYDSLDCIVERTKKTNKDNDLKIYAPCDVHSQCAMVSDIIRETKDYDNTLVVLPEKENMVPLFSMLSSVTKDINVSMGYPIKRSALFSLVEMLINAQKTKKQGRYYTKEYVSIIMHPIIKNLDIGYGQAFTRGIVQVIENVFKGNIDISYSGQVFIDINELEKKGDFLEVVQEQAGSQDILQHDIIKTLSFIREHFFEKWGKVNSLKDLAAVLKGFIAVIMEYSDPERYPLQFNVIDALFKVVDNLEHINIEEEFSVDEIFSIFKSLVENEKTKFAGFPLKGIQVSEMMETRALCFKNVILMDLNEGIIPYGKINEPLIPVEVMRMLELSDPEIEEAIQKYHFNRIINTSEKAHLLYKNAEDSQKSRFLEDIIWTEQKRSRKLDVFSKFQAHFSSKIISQEKVKEKDASMVETIKNMTFSISSINTYIGCPMRFYYRYVLGIQETENILEGVQPRHIGDFVHKLLEEVFKKYINVPLIIDQMFKKDFFILLQELYKRDFENKMGVQKELFKDIIQDRLEAFLENERQRAEELGIRVSMVEENIKNTINTKAGELNLTAKIDRVDIDRQDNVYVLDYKAGSTSLMPSNIANINMQEISREKIKDMIRSVQLPVYLYLLQNSQKIDMEKVNVNAGLYYIRSVEIKWLFGKKDKILPKEALKLYIQATKYILEEICDKDKPFRCDKSARECSICPYVGMC
ncbi:MAG: exodeoxyribonuclease V subunit gamma [Candidatus Omnitrophica bacterium]|nr:exodeoxyribonuclease V subunit gamma [Candidatus Omnitrophota bacterium]